MKDIPDWSIPCHSLKAFWKRNNSDKVIVKLQSSPKVEIQVWWASHAPFHESINHKSSVLSFRGLSSSQVELYIIEHSSSVFSTIKIVKYKCTLVSHGSLASESVTNRKRIKLYIFNFMIKSNLASFNFHFSCIDSTIQQSLVLFFRSENVMQFMEKKLTTLNPHLFKLYIWLSNKIKLIILLQNLQTLNKVNTGNWGMS